MYVRPPRWSPEDPEKLQREREKAAKNFLAKGVSPEDTAKKVGLPVEQVRSLM